MGARSPSSTEERKKDTPGSKRKSVKWSMKGSIFFFGISSQGSGQDGNKNVLLKNALRRI
jgi:hypothetical protein